eukprot:1157408-Pelagomonas_calceolata.AAC.16
MAAFSIMATLKPGQVCIVDTTLKPWQVHFEEVVHIKEVMYKYAKRCWSRGIVLRACTTIAALKEGTDNACQKSFVH